MVSMSRAPAASSASLLSVGSITTTRKDRPSSPSIVCSPIMRPAIKAMVVGTVPLLSLCPPPRDGPCLPGVADVAHGQEDVLAAGPHPHRIETVIGALAA